MRRELFILFLCLTMANCTTGGNAVRTTKHSVVTKNSGIIKTYRGVASWYGRGFHGRKTANGERYNMYGYTAAHKTLPFGTTLKVTNDQTKQSILLRINDRGPFIKGRELDVTYQAAKQIGLLQSGHANLKIDILKYNLSADILALQDTKVLRKVAKKLGAEAIVTPVSSSPLARVAKR